MLDIVTWNMRKVPSNIKKALRARAEYDVIAVQEATILPNRNAPACPARSGYTMIYGGGRHAMYIRNIHGPETWEAEANENWCAVRMLKYKVKIWNIYNPPDPASARPLIRALSELDPDEHNIFLGDMNVHDPLWDEHDRKTTGIDEFITAAERARLGLLTPKGECTWFCHGKRNSTIDLIWATYGSTARYMGSDDALTGSDHVAQRVRFGTGSKTGETRTAENVRKWKRTNIPLAEAEAYNRFGGPPPEVEDTAQLEALADFVINHLNQIADRAVPTGPRTGPGDRREWWTPKVVEASKMTKAARRKYAADPSRQRWEDLKEAEKSEERTISESDRERWRTALGETSWDDEKLWALERWARLRSWEPYEVPKIPDMTGEGGEPIRTHGEKAQKLAGTFFPEGSYELGPLPGLKRKEGDPISIRTTVTPKEIENALKHISPWKAPGEDGIPTGFLKACGKPFYRILAYLATKSFELGHFPTRFRAALVIVLRKPGKTPTERKTPKGWRPISLLSTTGKVIEKILGDRIAAAAEAYELLPDGQMGNRRDRSTEAALKICVETIRTAWRLKGLVALLLLDISSAFDAVPHSRLLEVARAKGYPENICRWIKTFLEGRTARLRFDGETTAAIPVRAGVPQGSPLSPILFILYISTLYETLKEVPNILVVGFADDTNILSFGPDTEAVKEGLLRAWKKCEEWSRAAGLTFNPTKSELIYFTKRRKKIKDRIQTGGVQVKPRKAVKFLGIWLDRKLQWKTHTTKLQEKLKRQILALTGIASSTYGCSYRRARAVYKVAIRSAMVYGASIFHKPTEKGGKPQGPVRSLAGWQSKCLRVVTGAFRATPLRMVETEALIPPLDLYMNERVAETEKRFEAGRIASISRAAVSTVVKSMTNQRRRRLRKAKPLRASWYQRQGKDFDLEAEWRTRWETEANTTRRRPGQTWAADTTVRFDRGVLKRHDLLRKHESSLLTQARTGRIGLASFLFTRGVPEVNTPICRCGEGKEDIYHIVLWCPRFETQRAELSTGRPVRTRRDLDIATDRKRSAREIIRWVLDLGILEQYKLAEKLDTLGEMYRNPGQDPTRIRTENTSDDT